MESNMEVPQKQTEILFDPGIPLLGIYPKKTRYQIQKKHMQLYVYCSTIYNSQDMEAT